MPQALLAGYPRSGERFDELFAEPGVARPHWTALFEHLLHSGRGPLQSRARAVQRLLRENGVTYNVYADPHGITRPWDLDLLPMIVSAREWATIEAAVIQRATLLNRILADVYGEQSLLRLGLMPAALVHGHRGFLRPCHGIEQNRDTPLHLYAADLARSPDGRWWVIGDRTQGPTGAGYAIENRLAISRAFPDLFRSMHVQRLAGFFATLRDSLADRAPRTDARDAARDLGLARAGAPDEAPLIVLLTPGHYNETYNEQAFLARYLGFPLVMGQDLTVRHGFVWMKTLSGLQRVHVILRRLDDDFCDPLELRSDSALGVPGLTEATRRGNVVIANGLGSSLLESGALLGFLPHLCRRMLGEPLAMPSVGTWWCGEPAALEDAISRLDSLVIKPAFPQLREPPVFGQDLSGAARDAFVARLRAASHNYVAQEMVQISQAPLWHDHGVTAAAVGIRVYACATARGYVVMPGGLTRVASGPDQRVISMQMGGSSKDTWVLTDGAVNPVTLLAGADGQFHPVRGDERLASRTVENLYWFGRYSERADNMTRLLRKTLDTLLAVSPDERGPDWEMLIVQCHSAELLAQEIEAGDEHIESRLLAAVFDAGRGGLPTHLRRLYDVASRLHERLSLDNWRVLNQIVQRLAGDDAPRTVDRALARLDEATVAMMTLSGFAIDGMTRDLGWRFLSMGRRIERLQYMAMLLQNALTMRRESNLDWLLELGDSIATYRARYVSRAEWPLLLDLLVDDETNPRSIRFQIDGLAGSARRIAHLDGGKALAQVDLLQRGLQGLRDEGELRLGSEALVTWLRTAFAGSYQLSDFLCQRFFSYSGLVEERTLV